MEELLADPLNTIFNILRISDDLKKTINSNSSTTKVSTATIENTFLGYSYMPNDKKFSISLNLQPLTQDVRAINLDITHNDSMELTDLFAKVNFIDLINIELDADLYTSDVSYGTDVELEAQKNSSNYN